jgi:hypothetical protein
MAYNMDTESVLKSTFYRLSVDDKRRVMTTAPLMRDRAIALRAGAIRAAATVGEGLTVADLVERSDLAKAFVDYAA